MQHLLVTMYIIKYNIFLGYFVYALNNIIIIIIRYLPCTSFIFYLPKPE